MGICEVVRDAARAIRVAYADQDSSVVALTQVLETMPDWYGKRRLDSWEEAVQWATWPVPADNNKTLCELLEGVFEFGAYNLYCKFDADGTRREYDKLVALLASHGLRLKDRSFTPEW